VDRKGRKFLLTLGTSGIIVSIVGVGLLFCARRELAWMRASGCKPWSVPAKAPAKTLTLNFNPDLAARLLAQRPRRAGRLTADRASLAHHLLLRELHGGHSFVRSDDTPRAHPDQRASCVPGNRIEALFKNPCQPGRAQTRAAEDEKALIVACRGRPRLDGGHRPLSVHGVLCAGPGVAVLALSELMPHRIRSNGIEALPW